MGNIEQYAKAEIQITNVTGCCCTKETNLQGDDETPRVLTNNKEAHRCRVFGPYVEMRSRGGFGRMWGTWHNRHLCG